MYLIYLRKSRADRDAEARGEGETLARHEKTLAELAIKMDLTIGAIYKEIVSGETISSRPKMQQLILEVMQGKWDGVLVMEVERLARGDTKDQGTVAEAFKFSNTKIITPAKTFDPLNEYDEEYFEFNLFMSRREYKTINRRIQRGRIAAFEDGWYISGTAPYGYEKVKKKENKGYVLEIIPEEAEVVRLIFGWYATGELQPDGHLLPLGSYQIRDRLNAMQVPSRTGFQWSPSSIMDIIRNPIYSGYQRWSWRKVQKQMVDGKITESRPKDDDCPKVKGRFTPIITEEQYEQAQLVRQGKPLPKNGTNLLQNPLTGLVHCTKCGALMSRAPSNTKANYPVLRCPNSKCDNISAPLYLVEKKLIDNLTEWLPRYELDWPEENKGEDASIISFKENAYKNVKNTFAQTENQLKNAYDLLEQGVYSIEVFQERRQLLDEKKSKLALEMEQLKKDFMDAKARELARQNFIPKIRNLISVYWESDDVYAKNEMLKDILSRVDYLKTERNKKGQRETANFTLHLYPRFPKN